MSKSAYSNVKSTRKEDNYEHIQKNIDKKKLWQTCDFNSVVFFMASSRYIDALLHSLSFTDNSDWD